MWKLYQLCLLQNEMHQMKEENKLLRKAIDKTMKDHYNLQVKLANFCHPDHPKVCYLISLFLIWLNIHIYSGKTYLF